MSVTYADITIKLVHSDGVDDDALHVLVEQALTMPLVIARDDEGNELARIEEIHTIWVKGSTP